MVMLQYPQQAHQGVASEDRPPRNLTDLGLSLEGGVLHPTPVTRSIWAPVEGGAEQTPSTHLGGPRLTLACA